MSMDYVAQTVFPRWDGATKRNNLIIAKYSRCASGRVGESLLALAKRNETQRDKHVIKTRETSKNKRV